MNRNLVARVTAWVGTGALVVLGSRSLAYALVPSPLARTLQHGAGGPRLPLVALVALGLALAGSSAIVWLASLGVRERRRLEPRPLVEEPRLRLGRLTARTVGLFAAASLAFVLLESYVHRQAGLGWHGLHCLVGPVHRDAIPILAALSLLASAIQCAVEHTLSWMRRTLAQILPERPRIAAVVAAPGTIDQACPSPPLRCSPLGARGPPVAVS